jgi:hypothetical protein
MMDENEQAKIFQDRLIKFTVIQTPERVLTVISWMRR